MYLTSLPEPLYFLRLVAVTLSVIVLVLFAFYKLKRIEVNRSLSVVKNQLPKHIEAMLKEPAGLYQVPEKYRTKYILKTVGFGVGLILLFVVYGVIKSYLTGKTFSRGAWIFSLVTISIFILIFVLKDASYVLPHRKVYKVKAYFCYHTINSSYYYVAFYDFKRGEISIGKLVSNNRKMLESSMRGVFDILVVEKNNKLKVVDIVKEEKLFWEK